MDSLLEFTGYETAWQVRVYGDEQSYARPPPKDGTTSYSAIALRPYKWPGAVTVYQVRVNAERRIEWNMGNTIHWRWNCDGRR